VASQRLLRFVAELRPKDRRKAEKVLTKWATFGDAKRQFHALGIIDELAIVRLCQRYGA
jgi:uncharacterized protein HemY